MKWRVGQKWDKSGTNRRAPDCWFAWSQGKKWDGKSAIIIENSMSWQQRAAAWDDHKRREAELAEVEENKQFFITLNQKSREAASEAINETIKGLKNGVVDSDKASSIKSLIDSVIRLAEFIKGEKLKQPIDGEVTILIEGLDRLSDDELRKD